MLTLIRYEMKKTMPIKLVSVALLLIFEVYCCLEVLVAIFLLWDSPECSLYFLALSYSYYLDFPVW